MFLEKRQGSAFRSVRDHAESKEKNSQAIRAERSRYLGSVQLKPWIQKRFFLRRLGRLVATEQEYINQLALLPELVFPDKGVPRNAEGLQHLEPHELSEY